VTVLPVPLATGRADPVVSGPPALVRRSLTALSRVLDPELDEPVTDLGFVDAVHVDPSGAVEVELRLPTYFCAPNFAYLMVADAHAELSSDVALGPVRVRLVDHFASEEINAGVAVGDGFAGAFPGLADGELEELRLTFRRKAHTAAQERLASRLQRRGLGIDELAATTLGDLSTADTYVAGVAGIDLLRLRRRRTELGLPAGEDAALLLDDDGRALSVDELPVRLRFARTTRVSIEGNAELCRGLLATRYGLPQS
jgi:metal-sulfur cluster biosynthetic enzyme